MKIVTLSSGILLAVRLLHAQGTFQNLNFESATVPLNQPETVFSLPNTWVAVSAALPGWSASVSTNQLNTMLYNSQTAGSAAVSLIRTNTSVNSLLPIEARNGVLLIGGLGYTNIPFFYPADAAISQTGLVPSLAQSLRFKAKPDSPITPFTPLIGVSLDGVPLSLLPLQTTSTYTLYGADVSTFAGQMRALRFTAFSPGGNLNTWNLDSIEFSPEAVPEPGIFALLGLGALFFGWRLSSKSRS